MYIHPNYTSVDAVNAYYEGLDDQLVFSADWPYVPMTDARAFIVNSSLSDMDKELFSHLSAEKLLHIYK